MTDQPTRVSRLDVQGRCPACGGTSLFLGDGGYVTCSRIDCPEPDAASTLIEKRPAPAGLRDQYAALFRCPPGEVRLGDEPPGTIADAVLAVRDRELEKLRAQVARVRRLCELTIRTSVRVQAIDQARDTLAVLEPKEDGRG